MMVGMLKKFLEEQHVCLHVSDFNKNVFILNFLTMHEPMSPTFLYQEEALGQWLLPLTDGFRVRNRVPGVWGSIPSQVVPVTFGAQCGAGRLDRCLTFL